LTSCTGGTFPAAFYLEYPMRKVFILFAAAAALTTAACNTVAGVGRDTAAAGSAVTEAAEDAKN
jgi:predicted small secreted protein